MLKSFKDKEAERLFTRKPSKKLSPEIQRIGLSKLRMLNRAKTLEDLRIPPGNPWKLSRETAWGNIVSESMTGGEFALYGNKTTSMKLRLLIIMRG